MGQPSTASPPEGSAPDSGWGPELHFRQKIENIFSLDTGGSQRVVCALSLLLDWCPRKYQQVAWLAANLPVLQNHIQIFRFVSPRGAGGL